MIKKIITRIIVIILLVLLLLCGGYFAFKRFGVVKTESNLAMVDRQLSYCQELATAKFRYIDIITLKKSAGFSKSYSIVKFTGIIRAGIADLSKIDFKISSDKKSIKLKVPKAEVLGNDIVDQAVFDEKRVDFCKTEQD